MDEVYYIPRSPEAVEAWEKYRREYAAHKIAAAALAKSIGARQFRLGFGGGLVAVGSWEDKPHLSFSQTQRRGGYPIISRGRSQAQKAAIEAFEVENKKLRALLPSAWNVAESQGFIDHIEFTYDGGSGSFGTNPGMWETVQVVWEGKDAQIFLVTGDVQAQIEDLRNSKHYNNVVVTPDRFDTPAGYERISKARYEFMVAEYKLKKEESKVD